MCTAMCRTMKVLPLLPRALAVRAGAAPADAMQRCPGRGLFLRLRDANKYYILGRRSLPSSSEAFRRGTLPSGDSVLTPARQAL